MWQKQAQPYIDRGELIAIGVVQEQHPDRTRLYRQWRNLKWPLFVDSMNTLQHVRVVPIPMAIDENGVVVNPSFRPSDLDDFMKRPKAENTTTVSPIPKPNFDSLRLEAEENGSWLKLGQALFNYGTTDELSASVVALEKAVQADPASASVNFSLGVALRRRYESPHRQPNDSQKAVEHWGKALEIDPNHYIYRRRLQQYGPRLDKPYNFYFWVAQAREDIIDRGETPIVLTEEPMGSEIAAPQRRAESSTPSGPVNHDPQGRINRDTKKLVQIETLVTPGSVQPGHRVRVRATFRLDPTTTPLWNNEADDLELWVELPKGLSFAEGGFTFANPDLPETGELRQLEFELLVAEGVSGETFSIPGHALYYVCEDSGGTCYYLRQDFSFDFSVSPEAPTLQ